MQLTRRLDLTYLRRDMGGLDVAVPRLLARSELIRPQAHTVHRPLPLLLFEPWGTR
jgi:hypothetical protein